MLFYLYDLNQLVAQKSSMSRNLPANRRPQPKQENKRDQRRANNNNNKNKREKNVNLIKSIRQMVRPFVWYNLCGKPNLIRVKHV